MNLKRYRLSLEWYVGQLAEVMSKSVSTVFPAIPTSKFDSCPERLGLWLSPRGKLLKNCRTIFHGSYVDKVGFIGIRAQRWIVSHGLSLNVTSESTRGFKHIDPCGLGSNVTVVSCQDFIKDARAPTDLLKSTEEAMLSAFSDTFNCKIEPHQCQ